jgi:hypothetical protein
MAAQPRACPRCGGREVQPAGVLKRHISLWALLLGGWLFSLLWSGSRKQQVRCVQCETLFERSTRTSRVVLVLLILFVLLTLLGLWAESSSPPDIEP